MMGGRRALDRLRARIQAAFHGSTPLLTDSGTSALSLAMAAAAPAGMRPRIALPAYGCFDLMTAADTVDAEVILYDLDPATLSPDADSLRRAVLSGAPPHGIVVAHWYGLPADLSGAVELAQRLGALVIDDAAQGVGVMVNGRPAGMGGDFGVLSFGRGKGRTGGGGGALIAATDAAQQRIEDAVRNVGAASGALRSMIALTGQWALGRPSLYGIPAGIPALRLGETPYHRASPPTAMSAANAAVADAVWDLSEREVPIRRDNAERWRRTLSGRHALTLFEPPASTQPGWLRFPVCADAADRSLLLGEAARNAGIARGYPASLQALPVAAHRLSNRGDGFPGAEHLSGTLITLPTHSWVRPVEVEFVKKMLGSA